jgi:hypothetical protein
MKSRIRVLEKFDPAARHHLPFIDFTIETTGVRSAIFSVVARYAMLDEVNSSWTSPD